MTEDDRSGDFIVLGDELAAARSADERHVTPGPSPIDGSEYPARAGELWRWSPHPLDAVMSEFVRAYVAASTGDRSTMRASLTMDDLYTVLLFARRRGLEAMRTGDPQLVTEVFDALSAVDVERIDDRDLAVAAMLGVAAASRVGVAATAAAAGAIDRAAPEVAEILDELVEEEIDLAGDAGFRMVTTSGGLVLLNDFLDPYDPERDLVSIALDLVTVIEDEGSYRVNDVTAATVLAPVWVGGEQDVRVVEALRGLTGCVSISANPVSVPTGEKPHEHDLTIYLAEAATAADAAALAAGADRGQLPDAVVLGVSAGQLCATVVASCAIHGHPAVETDETLVRLRAPVAAVLTAYAEPAGDSRPETAEGTQPAPSRAVTDQPHA